MMRNMCPAMNRIENFQRIRNEIVIVDVVVGADDDGNKKKVRNLK